MASTVTRPHSGREPLENKAKWEISDNCLNVVAKSGGGCFPLKVLSANTVTNQDAVPSVKQLISLTTLSQTTTLAL